jgi:dolichol-phosphate mannosyltransferase
LDVDNKSGYPVDIDPSQLDSNNTLTDREVHKDSALPYSYKVAIRDLGKVLVIIPTYNELESLPVIVAGIRDAEPDVHILIADDNSPDGTGEVANTLSSIDGSVHVLHRKQKAGLGAAYLDAFSWAKTQGFEVVVEMDADGSHRPIDLTKILDALSDNDVVLGSRWVNEGQVVNWAKSREVLSRGGNLYTRMWLGIPIKDATGGFRAYRMSALDQIDIQQVESQGYCFQVDMAWRATKAGLRVAEVPITFVERELGESKMDSSIVKEALWRVTQWGIEKRYSDLKRVFGR